MRHKNKPHASPRSPNHRLATLIVLLTFLPTVAFARAAARRDIEEYFALETMEGVARASAAPLVFFYEYVVDDADVTGGAEIICSTAWR